MCYWQQQAWLHQNLMPYSTLSYFSTLIQRQDAIWWKSYRLEISGCLEGSTYFLRTNYLKDFNGIVKIVWKVPREAKTVVIYFK